MTAVTWPAWGLCMGTGALLGLFFLLLQLIRLLLRGGRFCQAIMDVFFCVVCAAVAFLCALALDKGRLRFFQVSLQLLGGWGTVAALAPLLGRLARGLKWLRAKLGALFRRLVGRPLVKAFVFLKNKLPRPQKASKKRKKFGPRKKNRKKHLKNL